MWNGDPVARKTDPETSHEAARLARSSALSQRQRVLLALVKAKRPLSPEEIGDFTGRKRLPELMRKGLAFPLGRTVPTKYGRKQRLWVATV